MHRQLFLFLSLVLLTQCTGDPAPAPPQDPASLLPPETQTGAGTFACLFNGKPMIATGPSFAGGFLSWPTILSVSGQTPERPPEYLMTLILTGALQSGQTFALKKNNEPNNPSLRQFVARPYTAQCSYSGNTIKTGQVELVKFDPTGRIAAGRFAYKLYEPGGCDTLRVTHGRFDVKF